MKLIVIRKQRSFAILRDIPDEPLLRWIISFKWKESMGSHISQKWYEITTGHPEIDRYGWVYRLVIENVDRCDWDYWLVIEIIDCYGWDYRLLIEILDRYGPKSDWILRLTIAMIEKKFGVWKRTPRDWRSRTSTAMIEKSTCNWEMERLGNKRGIAHVF